MLLLVLFGVLGAYQAYAEDACYGKDFTFPEFTSLMMSQRQILFTPKSSLGSARMVINEGKAIDPRLSFSRLNSLKLLDVTMDDEGVYSYVFPGSNRTMHIITLRVKDCSIKEEVFYGKSYSFDVFRAEQIEYSPSFNDRKMPVTLWSRNKAIEKAGWTLEDDVLVTRNLTPKDQGYYTLRDKNQKYLERYRISIEEMYQDPFLKRGEDLTISFPIDGIQFSLTFHPFHPKPGIQHTLIQDGNLVNSEVFEGRMELLSTGVEIREVDAQDAGTYRLYDSDRNLALVVNLNIRPLTFADFGMSYIVLIGGVVVAIVVVLCCCVKCCCKKKSPTSSPVALVYHHEATTNGQSQPYSMVPHASAANQQPQASDFLNPPSNNVGGGNLGPSSTSVTPAHVGPVHFQGSATGVDAPTVTLGFDCLSSDSGTQFEVPKGPNYPPALFLSSDTPSNDVYTSDKLNFL